MKYFFIPLIYIFLLTPFKAYSIGDEHFPEANNAVEEQEVFAEALTEIEIGQYRGASGKFDMDVNFTGNTSSGSVSGSNVIEGSSFSEASGLINIIQNSGNNVVIQAATEVNVTIN